MGGDQRQASQPFFDFQPEKQNLPYQTEGDQTQHGYSDEHSRVMMEDQRKRADQLQQALSRLGFVPEAWPRSMPIVPYRGSDPTISF
jgi:hypothetical protein